MRSYFSRATAIVSTVVLFAAACNEAPTGTATDLLQPQFDKKVKPDEPPDFVPVTVTFDYREGDRVKSDPGALPYSGNIRPNGSLIFYASEESGRTVCFDFAGQPGAPDIDCVNALLTTADPGVEDWEGMLEMPALSTRPTSGQFIWASVEYVDGKKKPAEWYLRYGASCDIADPDPPLDNMFSVYKLSDAAWRFGGENAILCRRWLRGPAVLEEMGDFNMPFELYIEKQ